MSLFNNGGNLPSFLEDLDELILRCRDAKARQSIVEAIASYRAGAFRSAIVGTWIAVCFDLIEKLRELALAGDKEAERQVQDLETTRRDGDLSRALKFERELLSTAKDKFELLSPLEYVDLERLQADRNRCAHPSLTADEQAYAPSAELARLHIHSAVTHLLQHPPVQGKYALDRLRSEISSDYFPTNAADAKIVFSSGPLRRPRDSLTRNLVVVLVKALLKEAPDFKRRARLTAAIHAVQLLHPEQFTRTLRETISTVFRSIPDEDIHVQVGFLQSLPSAWVHLDEDAQKRFQNYVFDLPSSKIESISTLLRLEFVQRQARSRLKRMSRKEVADSIFFDFHEELGDWMIASYLGSNSFDEANEWARQLETYVHDFTANQVRAIIHGARKNGQVLGSFQLDPFLKHIRSAVKITIEEFDKLLEENGFSGAP